MRRLVAQLGLGLLALLIGITTPAIADKGHERPKITVMKWLDPPLKAGSEELLKITAHDPDSSISEIQVFWGEGQGISFAHSYCLQGTKAGTPHTMKLGWVFDEPGTYEVEAVAYSEKKCVGGADTRHSKISSIEANVVSGTKSKADPDDLPAPLDISAIEHSQATDEATLEPRLIHLLRTFEAWDSSILSDPSTYISLTFDTDDDDAIERTILVDVDDQGNLYGVMSNAGTGEEIGAVDVTRADDSSLEVSFDASMLKRHLSSYRWNVITTYYQAEDPNCGNSEALCADFAPDDKLMLHNL